MRKSLPLVASAVALLVCDVDLAIAGAVLHRGEDEMPGTDLIAPLASPLGATATLNSQGDADTLTENVSPDESSPDVARCDGRGDSVFVVSHDPLADFVSGLRDRISKPESRTLSASVKANGLVLTGTNFVADRSGLRVDITLTGVVGLMHQAGSPGSTTHRVDLGSADAGWRTSDLVKPIGIGPAGPQRTEYQAQPIHSCIAK